LAEIHVQHVEPWIASSTTIRQNLNWVFNLKDSLKDHGHFRTFGSTLRQILAKVERFAIPTFVSLSYWLKQGDSHLGFFPTNCGYYKRPPGANIRAFCQGARMRKPIRLQKALNRAKNTTNFLG